MGALLRRPLASILSVSLITDCHSHEVIPLSSIVPHQVHSKLLDLVHLLHGRLNRLGSLLAELEDLRPHMAKEGFVSLLFE